MYLAEGKHVWRISLSAITEKAKKGKHQYRGSFVWLCSGLTMVDAVLKAISVAEKEGMTSINVCDASHQGEFKA